MTAVLPLDDVRGNDIDDAVATPVAAPRRKMWTGLLAAGLGLGGAMLAHQFVPAIGVLTWAVALGTLTLANNLLGLAAGPLVTGILADKFGLVGAMKIVPIVAVGALIALLIGRKFYLRSLAKVNAQAVTR